MLCATINSVYAVYLVCQHPNAILPDNGWLILELRTHNGFAASERFVACASMHLLKVFSLVLMTNTSNLWISKFCNKHGKHELFALGACICKVTLVCHSACLHCVNEPLAYSGIMNKANFSTTQFANIIGKLIFIFAFVPHCILYIGGGALFRC